MSMHHALLAGLISVATASNVAAPATATGAPADTVLCADTPRQTVADMRIDESHLDQALAVRREAGPDAAETRAATEAFCTWLADEGFWYD